MIRIVSSPYVISKDAAKEVVILDVPLFVRLMEYVKESISTDPELHSLVHEILECNRKKPVLSMEHYDEIIKELDVQTIVSAG